jgi:hypothetical protein
VNFKVSFDGTVATVYYHHDGDLKTHNTIATEYPFPHNIYWNGDSDP